MVYKCYWDEFCIMLWPMGGAVVLPYTVMLVYEIAQWLYLYDLTNKTTRIFLIHCDPKYTLI